MDCSRPEAVYKGEMSTLFALRISTVPFTLRSNCFFGRANLSCSELKMIVLS